MELLPGANHHVLANVHLEAPGESVGPWRPERVAPCCVAFLFRTASNLRVGSHRVNRTKDPRGSPLGILLSFHLRSSKALVITPPETRDDKRTSPSQNDQSNETFL